MKVILDCTYTCFENKKWVTKSPGAVVDLPDDEAKSMIENGHAHQPVAEPEAEPAKAAAPAPGAKA